jgi:acyl dehydratase
LICLRDQRCGQWRHEVFIHGSQFQAGVVHRRCEGNELPFTAIRFPSLVAAGREVRAESLVAEKKFSRSEAAR